MMTYTADEKMDQLEKKIVEYGYHFKGCTEDEIEQLRKTQGVDLLPEMYRRIMLRMGKNGMSQILWGEADCHLLDAQKKNLLKMALRACGIESAQSYFLINLSSG